MLHKNLNEAGWRVHKSAGEWRDRNGGGHYVADLGRPKISAEQKPQSEISYNSRVSSSRTTEKMLDEFDNPTPMRILNDSQSNLFVDYTLATQEDTVCESVFYEMIEDCKIFGPAAQDTDMCCYCNRGAALKQQMTILNNKREEYEFIKILTAQLPVGDERKMGMDIDAVGALRNWHGR